MKFAACEHFDECILELTCMHWSGNVFCRNWKQSARDLQGTALFLFYSDETRCWNILFWYYWYYEEANQGNIATTTAIDNSCNNVFGSVILANVLGTTYRFSSRECFVQEQLQVATNPQTKLTDLHGEYSTVRLLNCYLLLLSPRADPHFIP